MGKSGGSGGTQVVQPPRADIPNENLLQSSGLWRLHASSPYYSSPYRTMDFAQNYTVPSMQMPTMTNSASAQPWGLNSMAQPPNYNGQQGGISSPVNAFGNPSAPPGGYYKTTPNPWSQMAVPQNFQPGQPPMQGQPQQQPQQESVRPRPGAEQQGGS